MNEEWTYIDTIGFMISIVFSYYFFGFFMTLIGFSFIAHALKETGESNV